MSFVDLNLDGALLRALEALKFTNPTEIQRQAIPAVLAGHDLMASAQTGTGKTAAFVLPALQRLITTEPAKSGRGPRVLVLSPTRELAQQITDAVRDFSKFTKVKSGAVVGGMPYFGQERLLEKPLDILIATPGRLMDHMDRGRVDFSRLELLILDEADRMLDMGFVDDVEMIAAKTPASRQTLLFSATLEGEIAQIAGKLLKEPKRIQIAGAKEKHASITQVVHAADHIDHKMGLLRHYLADQSVYQAVVFVSTKAGTEDLASMLKDEGHAAMPLHGDMKQGLRGRVVERMQAGRLRVLVATDVAARGLDIKGMTHVFNFDLPMVAEDYVHRIGRTGRGGATGTAVSLVGPQDWIKLSRIERLTGQQFEEAVVEGLEPQRSRPQRRGFGGKPGGKRFGGGGYGRSGHGGGYKKPYGDRPDGERRDFGNNDRGPRRDFGNGEQRPPRREFNDGPRRDFGNGEQRPPRREFNDGPRRDFGNGEQRPPRQFNDGPRRDFGNGEQRPPRQFNDGPRRDFGNGEQRPPRQFNDGPRRDFGNGEQRPPRQFNDGPRRDFGNGEQRAPRREFNDGPRRDAPSGDRPYRAKKPGFRRDVD